MAELPPAVFDASAEILRGLADGSFRLGGRVVRDGAGRIVGHLDEVPREVQNVVMRHPRVAVAAVAVAVVGAAVWGGREVVARKRAAELDAAVQEYASALLAETLEERHVVRVLTALARVNALELEVSSGVAPVVMLTEALEAQRRILEATGSPEPSDEDGHGE